DGRAARSSSAAAESPRRTLAGTWPSRVATTLIVRGTRRDLVRNQCSVILGHQVCLVEHDEIGAKQLIGINLIKGVFVIDGGIGGALRCDFCRVVGKPSRLDGRPIH